MQRALKHRFSVSIDSEKVDAYNGCWEKLWEDGNQNSGVICTNLDKVCNWKTNTARRRYQCFIQAVGYVGRTNCLRLYLYVDGETDLRDPCCSGIFIGDQGTGRWSSTLKLPIYVRKTSISVPNRKIYDVLLDYSMDEIEKEQGNKLYFNYNSGYDYEVILLLSFSQTLLDYILDQPRYWKPDEPVIPFSI
eukprot:TRINITY_DN10872_c0_g1_i2.p1 TRINITY_DN10872_c0_g1~~TRINITY_DN10872_c0_g1_i2.p1  ORF type:complete len:191 (-),score=29.28 TRINITY_DN10872_c0_g1_i2:75-647(-)